MKATFVFAGGRIARFDVTHPPPPVWKIHALSGSPSFKPPKRCPHCGESVELPPLPKVETFIRRDLYSSSGFLEGFFYEHEGCAISSQDSLRQIAMFQRCAEDLEWDGKKAPEWVLQ
jgi:hypothetical protein